MIGGVTGGDKELKRFVFVGVSFAVDLLLVLVSFVKVYWCLVLGGSVEVYW